MNKFKVSLLIFFLLLPWSCKKKQDLVGKAFEGKKFDNALAKPTYDVPALEESNEERKDDTEISVLVDNFGEPKKESTFLKTGKEERVTPNIFAGNDPEAPILNFEEAKIYDIIHTLCELLHVNYIIDPSVKDQTVTIGMIESDKSFKTSELFDLILKLHDLTMVIRDSFVYILPIGATEVNPGLELLHGTEPNKNLRREELVMQLIPLKYVKPSDMNNVIKEFLSTSARVYEEPKKNILILVDKYQYIAKVMELIPIFDVDILQNKKMVFYELAHVDATETSAKLQEILSVYGYESDGDRLNLVPIETLNGILALSNSSSIFKEIDFWIDKFDKEAQYEEDQVFVYQVSNTTADSIAQTLGQIFGISITSTGRRGGSNASNRRTTSPNRNPNDPNNRLQEQPQANQTQTDNQILPRNQNRTDGEGPTMIIDEDNNNLIFMTTQREYSRIHKTLRKLDILPRQVFLEVTVLSVDLNDNFELGIDWSGNNTDKANPSENTLGAIFSADGAFSAGYTYTGASGFIQANINALKRKGYANILQQPHIMAIDNKAANISVGADVPIQTTTTNLANLAQGDGVTPASSSTIQYRQTGVNLAFTPHINANGVIRLEINLDISSAGEQGSTAQAVPISQNSLQTEMIVRDNQTVVMGGLIFDQESWEKRTIPLLGRIPILKHLFTRRTSGGSKSELIVMITPHLIDSEEKSIQISKEFKEKILKEFESFKDSKQ